MGYTPTKRPCPICSGSEGAVLHHQRFCLPSGHPLANGYDITRCRQCGCVYADTPTRQQDYDRFYAEMSKYEDTKTSTGGASLPWDVQRMEEAAGRIVQFLPDRDATILDIGCANGGLLHCLQERGYRHTFGCDPSPSCVRNTQALGSEAFVATLSALGGHDQAYDCLILSHVLEHVLDIPQALRAIRHVARQDGVVYVEVPDAMRYTAYLFSPFQDFNTEHINHFSAVGLSNLMGLAGFRPLTSGLALLKSSPTMPYPAIYGLWRNSPRNRESYALVEDKELAAVIQTYIKQSHVLMDRILERLISAVRAHGRVMLWGAGQLCFKLLAEAELTARQVIAIVDSNPAVQGRPIADIPVIAPSAIRGQDLPIVITSILQQELIAQAIRTEWGLANQIITLSQ